MRFKPRDIAAFEANDPGSRNDEPGEGADECRLAHAVATEDAKYLAWPNSERDTAQHANGAVAGIDFLDLKAYRSVPQIDLADLVVGSNDVERTLLENPAEMEDGHRRSQVADEVDVVIDDDDRQGALFDAMRPMGVWNTGIPRLPGSKKGSPRSTGEACGTCRRPIPSCLPLRAPTQACTTDCPKATIAWAGLLRR